MLYLITDTCILIDLERLGLLQQAGRLSQKLHILDIVIEVECAYLEEEVKKSGFIIESLSGDELKEAYRIEDITGKITIYDAMSYTCAKERDMVLATGDGPLRALADRTGVKYVGLLWFVKEMYLQGIIKPDEAEQALITIKSDKRFRIPEGHVNKEIMKIRKII